MRNIFSLLFGMFLLCQVGNTQVGYGLTFTEGIYQRFTNPESDNGQSYGSSGSAILNLGIGPKLWFGGNKFSISTECHANIGLLGLAVSDYKGLGHASFPFIANLNFGGLTGFDKEGKMGFALGGGFQYNTTELYYLKNSYEDQGVKRGYFRTYIVQATVGFGMSGFGAAAFVRYGFDPDSIAKNFNIGLQFDFNIPKLKMITNPESDL